MRAGDLPVLLAVLCALAAVVAWPSWPGAPWVVRTGRDGQQPTVTPLSVDVPETLDLLALALSGGADVPGSVRHVAETVGGSAGRELKAVAAALAWGLDDEAAWEHAPARWQPAARALSLAARAGLPPAGLLGAAAADLRRDAAARVDVATASLSVRLVLPLGLAFLPAFVLTTVVPVVVTLAGDVVGSA